MTSTPIATVGPSAPTATHDRAGRWSRLLGIGALIGATISCLVGGGTLGPMEAAHGRHLADTPASYQAALLALGGVTVLCAVLAVLALALGIMSLARHGRSRAALWGVVCAVLVPLAATAALIGSMILGATLL